MADPRPLARAAERAPSYEDDFFAWTQHTAALLRAKRFGAIDAEQLAEEVEDMGKRDRRELASRVQVLLAHLLKWHLQPDRRSASWRSTIVTQRVEIDAVLSDSPSLRPIVARDLERNYAQATKRAHAEIGSDVTLPDRCPWPLDRILDEEFLPG